MTVFRRLSLGLRVKTRILKLETINFIFKNSQKFDTKSFSFILDNTEIDIMDTEAIGLICLQLLDLQRDDVK